jgi:hypothetical protein
MKKVQFIIISTILSFGLIISAAIVSNAMDKANKSENKITVKGVAEKRIKADKAVVNVVLSGENVVLDDLRKDISEKEKKSLDLIKTLGISSEDYSIENLKVDPEFSEIGDKILKYSGSESIVISTENVEKIDEIYQKLLTLKLENNNLEVTKPEYYITSIERYKKDLLVDASKNAEYKAIEMLKVNNNEIAGVKNVTQGQFEILPDVEDTKRIKEDEQNQMYKKLRSVVTATYLIKY